MSGFFIKKPQYILPAFKATEKTLKVCDQKFGNEHHLDNQANAYRHALWNFLLSDSFYKVSGSMDKAVFLSKMITDLHEEIFPNSALSRMMDLHNNKIGRNLFFKDKDMDIILCLEQMVKDARKVNSEKDLRNLKDQLVYLKD
ncbi:DUF6973 domain-containing protein [Christiangramia sabulilitoris]|uniref:DUF6973 domain-containing protein n=1 Tax=Christiangramia sabulilitoris TaxID=2583991 RepID=UPI001FB61342|nr:hypothetical protein [Christiangramia sabulilitoris]